MKKLLALAFVLMAGAAGTAAAEPPKPTVFSSAGWDVISYPADEPGYTFITDTLGGNGHPRGRSAHATRRAPEYHQEGYVFMTDTLAPGGGPTVEVVATGRGFQWADAGVGAGAGVGALVLLTGATLVALRRRGRAMA